jgi:hypothetical protein
MSRSRITIGGAGCVVVALATTGFGGTSAHLSKSTAPVSARIFSADVRSGPDKDLAVWGRLAVRLSRSGTLSGAVVRAGGLRVPVSGTASGRKLTLAFHLPAGTMSGTGTASHKIRTVADLPTRGTLTGPRAGDAGDWALSTERERREAERREGFKIE